ncbi:DNA-directed RNA polymerase III subunit RPC1 [Porphyridium purpureum]|uniref:DNA-directed RNA polymerase subunit n=1 Tax=Porphyridium purpureum TaxID=35688 RepID=A0A5J4YL80_PORPP|nr:DNA-directed RNA polymerase III subunit RPC1 [Porphyridium purpureum]|eukprot:POR6036..scf249_10
MKKGRKEDGGGAMAAYPSGGYGVKRYGHELELVKAMDTPKKIGAIEFSVPPAQEIAGVSVTQIWSRELYEHPSRQAANGGVLDARLGAIDRHSVCATCGLKLAECLGHFGHIELELPAFHIGYLKVIIQTLQMVCKTCSYLLLSPEEIDVELRRAKRKALSSTSHIRGAARKRIWALCRKKTCCPNPLCGALNGTVKKVGVIKIIHVFSKKLPKMHAGPVADLGGDIGRTGGNALPGVQPDTFAAALKANPDLDKHLQKVIEDLDPLKVLGIFQRIPRVQLCLLDMDAVEGGPENLILRNLPVPPLCVRPSVCQDPSMGSTEDDLTMKLTELVQVNEVIRMALANGALMGVVMEDWEYLQLELARYINSDLPGLPPAGGPAGGSGGRSSSHSGKPLRGISQRLKGKAGRFRGNLSGKRVDFSGRTVISPDPNLTVEQVGIPLRVAMILTYPERVTSFNLARLQRAVENGADVWPGATQVELFDAQGRSQMKRNLRFGNRVKLAKELLPGCVVERHLIDGDWVLFNRQPSLHRVSIMAHRVKVQAQRTFRFNESVCAPYNADYDGDEMNLHVPQTEEARAEAAELMSVLANLVTPKSGEPLIAATQDFLTCSHLLSCKDVFMDAAQFAQACSFVDDAMPLPAHVQLPQPSILKPMRLWTGKQVISFLIQYAAGGQIPAQRLRVSVAERTYTKMKHAPFATGKDGSDVLNPYAFSPSMDPSDGYVVVRGGSLVSGRVGKATMGSGSKAGVFYHLWKHFGAVASARAMHFVSKLAARLHSEHGFSIGVDDVKPSLALRQHKHELLARGYASCDSVIQQRHANQLQNRPGCTQEQTMEALLNAELSKIREDAGRSCIQRLDPATNAALIMAQCGSKGSTINISQMVACVGQQTVSGSRPPDGFQGRSLPHFERGARARMPDAKGFVENSFFSGMTCTEFFFHTMAGREGLVDTAVKTAETGYMQRRLMKALEDLGVHYDGTVRASDGTVVQFTFGDDGLDPCLMELDQSSAPDSIGVFDCAALLDEVQAERRGSASASKVPASTPSRHDQVPEADDDGADKVARISRALQSSGRLHPDKMRELFEEWLKQPTVTVKASSNTVTGADLNSESRFQKLRDVLRMFVNSRAQDLENRLEHIVQAGQKGEFESGTHERAALYAACVARGVTQQDFERFLLRACFKVARAEQEPGSTVGAIAAQSIGEPGTQMTLKTFHFAGVASMNITLGVPRLKEIINASKQISTPIIAASLVNASDVVNARIVKGRVEACTIGQLAVWLREVYRRSKAYMAIKLDMVAISKLQLDVNALSVQKALLATPKLKLSEQDVEICAPDLLRVHAYVHPSTFDGDYEPYASKHARTLGLGMSRSKAKTKSYKVDLQARMQLFRRLVPSVVVSGIASVERVVINDKGSSQYELLVEGDDLLGVMAVAGVRGTHVTCNHIISVEHALGIEAARATIMSEVQYTMQSHGMTIDPRHIMLLADVMSYRGEILGITRFGIVKMKTSTLMLASFEMTVDHLFDAAVHNRRDDIVGVSECIIMGVPIPLGSGIFKVLRDTQRDVMPKTRSVFMSEHGMNLNL